MMLFNYLSCLSRSMGIFSHIFATFCSHTTAFSTQVQRKINPFNSIYTSTVGMEYPSQPAPHRCISLWKKSRQYMSAGYPLPSHKDHISVTLEWKYCLVILHLDSSVFLLCFVHALLKKTVLLSNKLQKQVETSNCSSCDGLQMGDLHLSALGCSHKLYFKPCQYLVADLGLPRYTVIHVCTISCLTKVSTKKGWWWFPLSLDLLTPLFPRLPIEVWLQLLYSDVV